MSKRYNPWRCHDLRRVELPLRGAVGSHLALVGSKKEPAGWVIAVYDARQREVRGCATVYSTYIEAKRAVDKAVSDLTSAAQFQKEADRMHNHNKRPRRS